MIINLEKNPQYGDPSDGGKWMKVCKHGSVVQARTRLNVSTIKNEEFCILCQVQKRKTK